MTGAELLGSYQTMLALSRQMLGHAGNGDWGRVAALEMERSGIVARLKVQKNADPLSGTEQEELAQLIRDILAVDADIKTLTDARLGELHGELRSIGNAFKLDQTYGKDLQPARK